MTVDQIRNQFDRCDDKASNTTDDGRMVGFCWDITLALEVGVIVLNQVIGKKVTLGMNTCLEVLAETAIPCNDCS